MDEKTISLIKQRQSANLNILQDIKFIIEQYPDLRFTQILSILNLDKDNFYEESVVTLNKVRMKVAEIIDA
jgi:hypothetical protein